MAWLMGRTKETAKKAYEFAVVVDVPTGDRITGNLATALDIYRVVEERRAENEYVETVVPVPIEVGLGLREPVFNVGEILILDRSGREVGYPGRKPSKWDVRCEFFDDLDLAVKRSKEVFEESLREQAAKDDS